MVGFWPIIDEASLFSSFRLIVVREGIKTAKYRIKSNVSHIQRVLQLTLDAGSVCQTHFWIHSVFTKYIEIVSS